MNDTNNIDDSADYEEGSMLDRIKESPRTVSALIIILIVAAAIYAFSGNETPGDEGQTDQVAVTTEQADTTPTGTPEPTEATTEEEATTATPAVVAPTSAPVTQEQLQEAARTLPEPRKTENAYVEVAQAGDGVTHLSRRAATRWLAENQAGYTVTNEHRIFIEDYLKDRLGSHGVSIGEEQSISFDMVKEAVDAAGQLNETQLRNLSQYTHALS